MGLGIKLCLAEVAVAAIAEAIVVAIVEAITRTKIIVISFAAATLAQKKKTAFKTSF